MQNAQPKSPNQNRGRPQHHRPKGSRNPFIANYETPDTGGVVSLSTRPRPVTLVLEKEQARELQQLALSAGNEALAKLVERKLTWTQRVNTPSGTGSPKKQQPRRRRRRSS